MLLPLARIVTVVCAILFSGVLPYAQTLPLPQSLVGASTDEGESLLVGADAREAFFPLASNFVTQQNQAFCGVASMVMVLNALELPAPAVPAFDPYRTFTQDNVFDSRTEAVLPVEVIKKMGITLDQLGGLLAVQPVTVAVHHAADSSVEVSATRLAMRWQRPVSSSLSIICARRSARSVVDIFRRLPPSMRSQTASSSLTWRATNILPCG